MTFKTTLQTKVFTFSGEFKSTQQAMGMRVRDNGGNVRLKVKHANVLVVGNRASLLDIQQAVTRGLPIITESQLDYWITYRKEPKILDTNQVIAIAQGLEYDFAWGDKPDDFGAF